MPLYTAQLMEILHSVPNLVLVLGCLESEWPTFESSSFSPVRGQRFHRPLRLKHLQSGQAVELLSRRLSAWTEAAGPGLAVRRRVSSRRTPTRNSPIRAGSSSAAPPHSTTG